jgi:hypothetical protein
MPIELDLCSKVPDRNIPLGQVLVCGAHYHAVAGHRADKEEIKMAEQIEVELKLAPAPGSGLLLPYRITIPTPIGQAVIQAGAMSANGILEARRQKKSGVKSKKKKKHRKKKRAKKRKSADPAFRGGPWFLKMCCHARRLLRRQALRRMRA